MNHVIGPLRTSFGREGCKDVSPILDYGGPSHFVLAKYVPGIMPISGISKHLHLSALRLLNLSEVKTCHPAIELFSVALQMDGTMVKAGLTWDSNLGFSVGCKGPLTYQTLEDKDLFLDGSFLKQNLVTEVDFCVLVSLYSNVALSLGYILQSGSGKSGPEIIKKYTEVIKTVSKCKACVQSKPAQLNTLPPETPCCNVCLLCWNQGELCEGHWEEKQSIHSWNIAFNAWIGGNSVRKFWFMSWRLIVSQEIDFSLRNFRLIFRKE